LAYTPSRPEKRETSGDRRADLAVLLLDGVQVLPFAALQGPQRGFQNRAGGGLETLAIGLARLVAAGHLAEQGAQFSPRVDVLGSWVLRADSRKLYQLLAGTKVSNKSREHSFETSQQVHTPRVAFSNPNNLRTVSLQGGQRKEILIFGDNY